MRRPVLQSVCLDNSVAVKYNEKRLILYVQACRRTKEVNAVIRAALIEDNEAERAHLAGMLTALCEREGCTVKLQQYASGTAFLSHYHADQDIVFLDIDMPGMNGIETARAIRRLDDAVLLIFVTNMAQYAITGYEVQAFDYILKPVNPYSFAIKLRRALARVAGAAADAAQIQVKEKGAIRRIKTASIRYAEVAGHYVIYHTTEGEVTEYGTLKEARAKLGPGFAQCSQSFLINLRYIEAVDRASVRVAGQTIYISRKMKADFLAAVARYLGGNIL